MRGITVFCARAYRIRMARSALIANFLLQQHPAQALQPPIPAGVDLSDPHHRAVQRLRIEQISTLSPDLVHRHQVSFLQDRQMLVTPCRVMGKLSANWVAVCSPFSTSISITRRRVEPALASRSSPNRATPRRAPPNIRGRAVGVLRASSYHSLISPSVLQPQAVTSAPGTAGLVRVAHSGTKIKFVKSVADSDAVSQRSNSC